MVANNVFKSDLYKIHNIVQNSMTLYPKELVVASLRDFFAADSFYSYRHDLWGYPQTPDHTDLPQDAGMNDNITTRLFIGESYRFDVIYYPSIIVRSGGSTSVPISFNRETSNIQWSFLTLEDGYGNFKYYRIPNSFIFAGAWEGTMTIDILAKDLRARDDLVDLVSILFVDIGFESLKKAGLIVKNVSAGGPSEIQDRNDFVFKQTITLQVRSEWRRMIPIGNVVDIINFAVEFSRVDPSPGPVAQNLTINTNETITDIINSL